MQHTYIVKVYDRERNIWVGTKRFTIPDFSAWERQISLGSGGANTGGNSQSEASIIITTAYPSIPDFGLATLIHNPIDSGPEIGASGAFTKSTTSNFNTYLSAHGFSIQTDPLVNDLSYYFDEHRNIRFTYTRHNSNSQSDSGYYCSTIKYCFDDNVIFDRNYPLNWSFASTIPWIAPRINTLVSINPHWYIITYNLENNSRMSLEYTQITHLKTLNQTAIDWFNNMEPTIEDTDNPYWDGGISDEDGGGGNFSDDSDDPEADELPGIDAIGTGFATIFKPSKSQLRSLSELFWNSNVFTFLQNLVENITDMFTSLAMVPFEVEAGSTVSVTWLGIDTAIDLTLAAKQYYEFNMGSIDLANDNRIFTSGSALDYSPFSTLGIYLPFIGYQELDIDECRGAVINLRYRIDILSGACVAIIKVAGRDIYQFTGNCLTQIPITNENMQSLVADAVNVGIAAAGAKASKGTMQAINEEVGASNMPEAKKEVVMAHASESFGHSQARLNSATANLIASGKPSFNKSGAVSSAASMMSVKQPYLFLTTPRQSIPEHYQRYCGFPSNITGKLGDFSGYTVVENIRLNGLVATSPEVAEIYDLLRRGVIV